MPSTPWRAPQASLNRAPSSPELYGRGISQVHLSSGYYSWLRRAATLEMSVPSCSGFRSPRDGSWT